MKLTVNKLLALTAHWAMIGKTVNSHVRFLWAHPAPYARLKQLATRKPGQTNFGAI